MRNILILFFAILSTNLFSQNTLDNELIPYGQFDKWGYCNLNKIILIKPEFDDVSQFKEGIAAVKIDNKWGFINRKGKIIIPAKYDLAYPFSEGLSKVSMNGKIGFIDKSGEVIIPFEYERGMNFSEGFAAAEKDGVWGYLSNEGLTDKLKLDKEIKKGSKINISKLTIAKYNKIGNFNEGLAWISKDNKWGYINKKGEMVIKPMFDFAWRFNEGLAAVGIGTPLIAKWGFINMHGEEVIPLKYDRVTSFLNGIAAASIDDKLQHRKWRYIDKSGIEFMELYKIHEETDEFDIKK